MNYIYTISVFIVCFCSCQKASKHNFYSSQNDVELYLNKSFNINDDGLARIENIQCNDSELLVFDYHSGNSFSLFDTETGKYIGRFGGIGQGPEEIPLGCMGNLIKNKFYIYAPSTGLVASYCMDSLRKDIKTGVKRLTKIEMPFSMVHFAKVIPINDSTFLGAGLYASQYQYVLFDNKNKIIDYNIEVYNAHDNSFHTAHKMITSSGTLRKHPNITRFAYFVRNSSNLDFFEVVENKIIPVRLVRDMNPVSTPHTNGSIATVRPTLDSPIGYLALTVGEKYVYALHTDKEVTNAYSSNKIRVFDWNGNFIRHYILDQQAYYICVNEADGRLYAAVKNKESGWSIVEYRTDSCESVLN